MNTIRCINCRVDNAVGLSYCTHCGSILYPAAQTTATTIPQFDPNIVQPKKGKNRNLIIAAILGGFAVLCGTVIIVGLLVYVALREKRIDTDIAAANSDRSSNTRTSSNRTTRGNTVPNVNAAANKSDDYDDTDLDANPITIPPSVGPFEQISSVIGNPASDFIGAIEVNKAVFSKQGKDVDFVLAKFESRDNATKNYNEFVKGLKSSGAKVIGTQKIKNRAGVVNGDISLLTYEKKWNALAASDKHGIRITAPDRYTLLEFVKEFDKVFAAK